MTLDYLSLGALPKKIGLAVMMMASCSSPHELFRFLRVDASRSRTDLLVHPWHVGFAWRVGNTFSRSSTHYVGFNRGLACLPVPQRCWGQLGRSEQAAFLGPGFGESVLSAVSHRSQHRPGWPKQAQTWPDDSTYSIVHGTPAFPEIGPIYFGLWCAKNGGKCADKVQPISNEKCANKVQLRRIKNEER
jgi:hypothetical protein